MAKILFAVVVAMLMFHAPTASMASDEKQPTGNEPITEKNMWVNDNTCHHPTCVWGPFDVPPFHRTTLKDIRCASSGRPPPQLKCEFVGGNPGVYSYCAIRDGNGRCFCENYTLKKHPMTVRLSGC